MKRYIRSATEDNGYTFDELSHRAKQMAEFCVYEAAFTEERYYDFTDRCSKYLESKLPGSDDFDYDFDLDDSMGAYFDYYATISLRGLYNEIKDQLSKSCADEIKQALKDKDYRIKISVGAYPRNLMAPDFLDDVKNIDTKSYNEFNDCANDYTQNLADTLEKFGYEYAYPWKDEEGLSKFCEEHNLLFDEDGELLD